MLKAILLLLAGAAGVVLFLASRKPDVFRVTRAEVINAPPEVVFNYINDIEQSNIWSPWMRMEPDARVRYEGPKAGVGASFSWEGKKIGKGRLTTTDTITNEMVRLRLEFFKPMVGTNTVEYALTREGAGTRVIWTIFGPNDFKGKVMSVFMNCETMMGGQLEQGLSNLKQLVEQGSIQAAAA